ncbi:MAG: hypothetical protein GY944_08215 [bacterium]|nr:hypothetical protein [bacterium]
MTRPKKAKRDVLAWVTPDKLTDWRRITLTRGTHPEFIYGSSDPEEFRDSVGKGTRLWVFACQKRRCPMLVARLVVKQCGPRLSSGLRVSEGIRRHYRAFEWIAVGDPKKSEFFAHNDAGAALAATVVERKTGLARLGGRRATWHVSDYQKLRRPTAVARKGERDGCVVSPGTDNLDALATRARRSVFISWKWNDNTRRRGLIREFAHALAQEGVMAWLDLFAIPMSPALRKVQRHQDRLEKLLKYGYRRCNAVVAIGTPNFGTQSPCSRRNWTKREWTGAIAARRQIRRFVYPLDPDLPAMLSDPRFHLEHDSPQAAARALVERLGWAPVLATLPIHVRVGSG